MAIAGLKSCFFIVWTEEDILVNKIKLDESFSEKVKINLDMFFKNYMCPILLDIKQLYYCAKCEKILYEQSGIETGKEEELHNSIQCVINVVVGSTSNVRN